jgi:hypothetical protein
MWLRLRYSKTNQSWEAPLIIPVAPRGDDLCPVRAVDNYLAETTGGPKDNIFLTRRIDKPGAKQVPLPTQGLGHRDQNPGCSGRGRSEEVHWTLPPQGRGHAGIPAGNPVTPDPKSRRVEGGVTRYSCTMSVSVPNSVGLQEFTHAHCTYVRGTDGRGGPIAPSCPTAFLGREKKFSLMNVHN